MSEIEAVETVEEWVFRDLSASTFSDEERRIALDGIDDVSDDLVTWERPIGKALTQTEYAGEKRSVQGNDHASINKQSIIYNMFE